jgi:hypothetical protein
MVPASEPEDRPKSPSFFDKVSSTLSEFFSFKQEPSEPSEVEVIASPDKKAVISNL